MLRMQSIDIVSMVRPSSRRLQITRPSELPPLPRMMNFDSQPPWYPFSDPALPGTKIRTRT